MMNNRAPCLWQIIKRFPQPMAVRNYQFRPINRTAHYRALYGKTTHVEFVPF